VRDFNIDTDSIFTITAPLVNGGISKSGGGALVLEPYQPGTFAGSTTVNNGILQAKGDGAFGTSAGGVTIKNGGTVKLDSGWTYGDDFTVTGPGALMPGGGTVREVGALVGESSTNRLTGAVVLDGSATFAGNTFLDPSTVPGTGGLAYRIGTLRIEGAGGVTGTGTLTLSGHGDGVIVNGLNTLAGGLIKDGAGRWTLVNGGSYTGPTTVSAGALRITNGGALGTTAGSTLILGGGALELAGGISVAEPFIISGDGNSS
jgi:autotransporter-associated beta strand protein